TQDFDWSISPDGSRIALKSGDQLPGQVRVLRLESGAEESIQLPRDWYIQNLRWDAAGAALFAIASTTEHFIARIELNGKSKVILNGGKAHDLLSLKPSPDGRYLAFGEGTEEDNAWLL